VTIAPESVRIGMQAARTDVMIAEDGTGTEVAGVIGTVTDLHEETGTCLKTDVAAVAGVAENVMVVGLEGRTGQRANRHRQRSASPLRTSQMLFPSSTESGA